MVAINHSEADVGGRAIHVLAKPIEHLDEAGFQRLRALWSNPPWSIVFARCGRAAGTPSRFALPALVDFLVTAFVCTASRICLRDLCGGASRDGGASVGDAAVAAAAAARDGGRATIRVARNAYRSHQSPARRPVWQSSPPQTWAGRGSRNLRRKHLQRYQVLCWR